MKIQIYLQNVSIKLFRNKRSTGKLLHSKISRLEAGLRPQLVSGGVGYYSSLGIWAK